MRWLWLTAFWTFPVLGAEHMTGAGMQLELDAFCGLVSAEDCTIARAEERACRRDAPRFQAAWEGYWEVLPKKGPQAAAAEITHQQPAYVDEVVIRAVRSITPRQMAAYARTMIPDKFNDAGRVYYTGCIEELNNLLVRSWPKPVPLPPDRPYGRTLPYHYQQR
jgi:hypothetical protein